MFSPRALPPAGLFLRTWACAPHPPGICEAEPFLIKATSRHTVRQRTTACPRGLGRRGDERGDMALSGMISHQRTHVA